MRYPDCPAQMSQVSLDLAKMQIALTPIKDVTDIGPSRLTWRTEKKMQDGGGTMPDDSHVLCEAAERALRHGVRQ